MFLTCVSPPTLVVSIIMDRGRIIFGVIGFSSSLWVLLPILKNWLSVQMKRVNLEMVSRALEEAEAKLQRV
nr:hypothetical protein CRG98_028070 [Tanacetum cinerariifolium]